MAINYTQAFNAGELSRNLDGRSDFEVYKLGCRELNNFFVLPQGGVERRTGSEFVRFAGSDGSSPARMIEFDFSSDIRYVIELGTDYAKVHYTDSDGEDQVVNVTELSDTGATVTNLIDYTEAELRQIQFNRRYDSLVLTCPTKEVMIFKRATTAPTFTIEKISYVYPPLMEINDTAITINPSLPQTDGATNIYTGTTTLTASDDIFHKGHEGAYFGIEHIRAGDKKEITMSPSGSGIATSKILDVSFSNWSFETSGTWEAQVTIERSIAGGTFEPYIVIGDTRSGVARNFKYASTIPEDANTELRVKVDISNAGFKCSLEAENIYHKGVVQITGVTATTNPVSTATAKVISMIQGGNRASGSDTIQAPDATVFWLEGAYSDYRGFPPASEFFENRLWLAGSKDQPADLFASAFGDIYNFLTGTISTDAIKRTIDSPEEPKWLEGKRYLFLGTAGTAVSVRSADKDALITQDNITTLVENSYGSAAIQAEIANDVVVYVQRDGLRLRELVYDQESDTFVGNDLNIINEDITESGIKEMFVQKQPNQIVWCIKDDGKACAMTYERGNQLRGWARIETDGEIYSAASIHDGGEDTIWACVKRTTGGSSPTSKYCIEKFHKRKNLDWYVDCGKQITGGGVKTGTAIQDYNNDYFKINITGHGYATGDSISISDSYLSNIKDNTYEVEYIDANNFYIRVENTTTRIPIQEFTITGAEEPEYEGTYRLTSGTGDINDQNTRWTKTDDSTTFFSAGYTTGGGKVWYFSSGSSLISQSTGTNFLWEASWSNIASFGNVANSDISVRKVTNKITGLSHLEGKTLQVLVDGNYISDEVVTSGEVSVSTFGETILAGLPYVSTLKPMALEPTLVNQISQGRVKALSKVIVRFFKTKGASVGEEGKQLTTYSVLDTQDSLGQALEVKTGLQRFFVASNYEREKIIEVRQDLPYPMTVLSIVTQINAEGV